MTNTYMKDNAGYCPHCDTVYDKPHECVSVGITEYNGPMQLNDKEANALTAVNSYVQGWNAAIEAAALIGDNYSFTGGIEIRKLKK